MLARTGIAGPTSLHALLIRDKKWFVIPSLTHIEKKGLPGQKTTDGFRDVSKTFTLSKGCEVSNSTQGTIIPIWKSPYMFVFI